MSYCKVYKFGYNRYCRVTEYFLGESISRVLRSKLQAGGFGVAFCTQVVRLMAAGLIANAALVCSQGYPAGRESKLGPMLDQGMVRYTTPELTLRLVRSSGTVAGLEPTGGDGFDFTPVFSAGGAADGRLLPSRRS